jgi:transcriptional regulator with GAF, ATPase, and Fis domain
MLKNLAIATLWFSHFCKQTSELTEVLYALEEANIDIHALHQQQSPIGPGIVFLDHHSSLSEVIEYIAASAPLCEQQIIAISLSALPQGTVWKLLKAGASDVFVWKVTEKQIASVLARLQYWEYARQQLQHLRQKLIGKSKLWQSTLRQIIDMAATNCPVLLLGESGTGKELVSKAIHELDQRKDKQELVVVDCTTIVPSLSGSELFGHEKGAFTNAISTRDGAFALAHEGSLFLDELGELPPSLQAELLRVLQEGTYKRVGSNTWRKTCFRLISATNRLLEEEVKKGNFRQDLFFRVSGYTCQLPPLRERREDIPLLVDYFLQQVHKKTQAVEPEVYQYLSVRDYPGNVRELQQLVSRIAYRHVGEGPFTLGDIPEADRPQLAEDELPGKTELTLAVHRLLCAGLGLKELKELVTNIAKGAAIEDKNGNLKQAAEQLGCSERILQMHKKGEEQGYLRVV